MHIPKNYFHDRMVLLLLTVNTFLTVAGSILVLLKIDFGRSDGYIVQYRANLGLSAFKSGSASTILGFIGFAVGVLVLHTMLSMRMYHHRRHFAIAVLGMGLLLLSMAVIVSNALLEI